MFAGCACGATGCGCGGGCGGGAAAAGCGASGDAKPSIVCAAKGGGAAFGAGGSTGRPHWVQTFAPSAMGQVHCGHALGMTITSYVKRAFSSKEE
jgi:4-aminobutyrate aminotransferase-like enzyme